MVACPNSPAANCGCEPYGGLCPVLVSPAEARIALVLAPTTGKRAAIRYAKILVAAGVTPPAAREGGA
jgi:hypothetical protein